MHRILLLAIFTALAALSGCTAFQGFFPSSGPLTSNLTTPPPVDANPNAPTLQLVDVTPAIAQKVLVAQKTTEFSEIFKKPTPKLTANYTTITTTNKKGKVTVTQKPIAAPKSQGALIGPGDTLEVNIWEASPAMLFGSSSSAGVSIVNSTSSKATTLPEQIVNRDGMIAIPFAGNIKAAGKTTEEIANEIVQALSGKANFPQVIVRLTRNTSANVTVVGEVTNSVLLPLTPKQEKLLDAIAMAGGVKQPINKVTIQLARGTKSGSMPLESLIKDPQQNIYLMPGDVVTAYYQPYSFTAMGATGQNSEVPFEGQGISMVQALARAGGLKDSQADAKGIFLFRFEDPSALPAEFLTGVKTSDGKVPVIYRLNLIDPSAFLTAQNFPMHNKDVLYISNASSVELSKFLGILVQAIYPVVNAGIIYKGQ